MESAFRTRVKICCISSLDETHTAIRFGADAPGLFGQAPSGPGVVADEVAAHKLNAFTKRVRYTRRRA